MLPSFLQQLDDSVAGRAVQVPPPPRFRPAGHITGVWIGAKAPRNRGRTGAQRAGLRYEHKVNLALGSGDWHYMASPQLHFTSDDVERVCIPDGVILRPGVSVVVEIKSQHMPEAWWQLRKLYEPVVRHLYPGRVLLVEVCRTFDVHMPFPEECNFLGSREELESFVKFAFDGKLAVFRWKL